MHISHTHTQTQAHHTHSHTFTHTYNPHTTHTHTHPSIQELEHKLRQYKQDSHFVEVARSKVLQYDELERKHKMVCAENVALR